MDPTIATIIGAVLGACLTGPVTYYFSKRLIKQSYKNSINIIKRQEFNKASSSFRKAFTKETRILNYSYIEGSEIAFNIIENAMVRHHNAAIIFKDYLCTNDINGFNTAWSEYSEPNKEKVPSKPFIEYDSLGNKEKEDKIRVQIIHRINKLLEFAKVNT